MPEATCSRYACDSSHRRIIIVSYPHPYDHTRAIGNERVVSKIWTGSSFYCLIYARVQDGICPETDAPIIGITKYFIEEEFFTIFFFWGVWYEPYISSYEIYQSDIWISEHESIAIIFCRSTERESHSLIKIIHLVESEYFGESNAGIVETISECFLKTNKSVFFERVIFWYVGQSRLKTGVSFIGIN